jgi:hypothetical protein
MRLSVVRPIETRKFIAVSRQVGVPAGGTAAGHVL